MNIDLAPAEGRDKNNNNSSVIKYFIRLIIAMFNLFNRREKKKIEEYLLSRGWKWQYSRAYGDRFEKKLVSPAESRLDQFNVLDWISIQDFFCYRFLYYQTKSGEQFEFKNLKELVELMVADNKDYLEMFL